MSLPPCNKCDLTAQNYLPVNIMFYFRILSNFLLVNKVTAV